MNSRARVELGCNFLVPVRRVRSYNVKQKGWVASVHHRSGALRLVEKLGKVLRHLHYGLAVGSRLGIGSFLWKPRTSTVVVS